MEEEDFPQDIPLDCRIPFASWCDANDVSLTNGDEWRKFFDCWYNGFFRGFTFCNEKPLCLRTRRRRRGGV